MVMAEPLYAGSCANMYQYTILTCTCIAGVFVAAPVVTGARWARPLIHTTPAGCILPVLPVSSSRRSGRLQKQHDNDLTVWLPTSAICDTMH